MDFPKDFIERARAIYPNCKELHTALNLGYCVVGKYLYNGFEADKTNSEKWFLFVEYQQLFNKNQMLG